MIAHPQMFDAEGAELHLGDLVCWSTTSRARYRITGWGMKGQRKYLDLASTRSSYRARRAPHLTIRA
jgi:hypothetical protein